MSDKILQLSYPILTLNVRGPSYLCKKLGQYQGCWCPGSLHCQDISSHDIDYIEYVGPSLTLGRILRTCVISMWRNDIKCKYVFLFPLKNLAPKGLTCSNIAQYGIVNDADEARIKSDFELTKNTPSISLTGESLVSVVSILEIIYHTDGLVQERRNSIANALELRVSCTHRYYDGTARYFLTSPIHLRTNTTGSASSSMGEPVGCCRGWPACPPPVWSASSCEARVFSLCTASTRKSWKEGSLHWWLSTTLWCLRCINNGDIIVLHKALDTKLPKSYTSVENEEEFQPPVPIQCWWII